MSASTPVDLIALQVERRLVDEEELSCFDRVAELHLEQQVISASACIPDSNTT